VFRSVAIRSPHGFQFLRDAVQGEKFPRGTLRRFSNRPPSAALVAQTGNLRHGVTGGHDKEAGAVSVRLHHGGPQGTNPKAKTVADILAGLPERKA
jgi:hypothetical protein